MPLKEHADYQAEVCRLKDTVGAVGRIIEENIEKKSILREDITREFENMDRTDSAQSYQRAAVGEALFDMAVQQLKALIKAAQKPYFSRIDIRREDSSETKKFYIGKLALAGDDIENPLIVDWRAPVAGVYYDGRLGKVTYEAPGGTQRAELFLKRQYTISKAELTDINDVDITANDAFLQAVLGENKDRRLQDIVSTIQAEQNRIIRAGIRNSVIVQGVAGSGKTTIALHRIAYLIYTYGKEFRPSDFLILAPNRLFLNYISDVLPELGVENIRQSTWADLCRELLGLKLKLAVSDEKFIRTSGRTPAGEEAAGPNRIAEFKSSLEFRDILDSYAEYLAFDFIPAQDFTLGEYKIFTAGDIKKIFGGALAGSDDAHPTPLYKRLPYIKKALQDKLKEETVSILQRIDDSYERQIQQVRDTVPPSADRRLRIVALFDERDGKMQFIKKAARTAVAKYFALLPKKDLTAYYRELITDPEKMLLFSDGHEDRKELLGFMVGFCRHNTPLLRRGTVEFEDLTPLLYLAHKLYGIENAPETKYIVADEAQDFSLFQLYTLREVFGCERFTLLGDLAQGIRSRCGIGSWQEVAGVLPKFSYMTLEQSYRTTVEIMNAANEVLRFSSIPGLVYAKPVVRYGAKPGLRRVRDRESLAREAALRIAALKGKGYKSVAVICKTAAECALLAKMPGMPELRQLSPDDPAYEGGTVIVPSYHAKGLEFDAVLICALTEDYIHEESDVRLLYVAMTRALHSLDFICLHDKLAILGDIGDIIQP